MSDEVKDSNGNPLRRGMAYLFCVQDWGLAEGEFLCSSPAFGAILTRPLDFCHAKPPPRFIALTHLLSVRPIIKLNRTTTYHEYDAALAKALCY